ncbi:MAG: hypothetical protein ACKVYV_01520 [Limisphaerales bacterium]
MPDDPNPPAAPPADPPDTAAAVAAGDADETDAAEIVRLQAALDAERGSRKKDQTRVAELEDEIHRLKAVLKPAAPKPAAVDEDWFEQLGRM